LPPSSVNAMQIPFVLRPLLYGRSRFRLPSAHDLPRGIGLRPFESRDRAICLTIYKDNERDRFPADFMVFFEFCLDSEIFLKLVLCIDDVPVAIGAVSYQNRLGLTNAWLDFGMVSPHYQGKGLGSALLIARLSLCPKPTYPVRLFMTNVEPSQEFYERFGFSPYGTSPSGRPGLVLPCNSALFDEREWRACRERVTGLGLTLPTIEVPRLNQSKNVPSRTGMSATVKVTTGAQIAFLVLLFGLVVLLSVDRPYNWLGALFILLSGILYRRERKRRQARVEAALRRHYGYPQSP
jgi:GNAT superfamily N-acetyltransferase